jgi:uncharacterized RDD family membrane protein YckC
MGRFEMTVEQVYFEPADKYKTLPRRIGAAIVDSLIFLLISFVVLKPFSSMGWEETDFTLSYLLGLSYIGYTVMMHWRFGATVGKLVFRIRVLDHLTEAKISLKQAVIRDSVPLAVELATLIGFVFHQSGGSVINGLVENYNAYWFFLEILTSLFNDKRRAIHDFMAGTVCVKVAEGFSLVRT